MREFRIILSLLLLIITSQVLTAQQNDSLMFKNGVSQYEQERYQNAERTFYQILKEYPASHFLTATKLMLAKSYYKLGEYRTALIVCNNFIEVHKESAYLDDVHFLMGTIYFREQKYQDAAEEWLWVMNNSSDSRLKEKAGDYVFQTMDKFLTEKEINDLRKNHTDETFVGLMDIVQAQKLIRSGQREKGTQELENFIEKYPYHLYADVARQLLQQSAGSSIASNSILLLKSGQEGSRAISNAITQGFFYAAYEMASRDPSKSIELDTLTLEPEVLSGIETTMPVLEKNQPLAVVGPIDNDETATLALLSRYEFYPYVSPLNSQNGLAALSPYAFQINPDAEIKGQFLAKYAVQELGFKTFAILAPADAYGQTIARSFAETVTENGGEVVEQQWYYDDAQDLSRQFKAIRKKGFYITFRDSARAADSTLSDVDIQAQFKQYMTDILFSDEGGRDIDSTQVSSTGIDGLFIATYPEYIPYIAPQFAFHNIKCTLLGNEGWNDPDQLMKQRAYLDGLIYVTAGYYDPQAWEYKAFLSRFRQQMHETPDMYHLLGYDIGKWMLGHYRPGISRQEFRDDLEKGDLYKGILENIKFGSKPRVNSQLNIIKFYLGQILKVK